MEPAGLLHSSLSVSTAAAQIPAESPIADSDGAATSFWSMPIAEIQRAVCRRYGISRLDMLSNRRAHRVVWPRQVAMWLCRNATFHSLPEIGLQFGRDHTTIIHGIARVDEVRKVDGELNRYLGSALLQFRVAAAFEASGAVEFW